MLWECFECVGANQCSAECLWDESRRSQRYMCRHCENFFKLCSHWHGLSSSRVVPGKARSSLMYFRTKHRSDAQPNAA
eukprot:5182734-Amphidinium_carterae.1